jgi:hypothetical protein
LQPAQECRETGPHLSILRRPIHKHADAPCGLLCPRVARLGDGHAAKKGDEFAPLHGLPQNMREASVSLCDRRRVRNGTQPTDGVPLFVEELTKFVVKILA